MNLNWNKKLTPEQSGCSGMLIKSGRKINKGFWSSWNEDWVYDLTKFGKNDFYIENHYLISFRPEKIHTSVKNVSPSNKYAKMIAGSDFSFMLDLKKLLILGYYCQSDPYRIENNFDQNPNNKKKLQKQNNYNLSPIILQKEFLESDINSDSILCKAFNKEKKFNFNSDNKFNETHFTKNMDKHKTTEKIYINKLEKSSIPLGEYISITKNYAKDVKTFRLNEKGKAVIYL